MSENSFFGKQTPFPRLSYELLDCPAFLCLTDKQQIILLDLVRTFQAHTSYGFKPISTVGFSYSRQMCRVICTASSFYLATKALEEKGFITKAENQFTGQAIRWIPCERWRHYQPNIDELEALAMLDTRLAQAYVDDPNQQLLQFSVVETDAEQFKQANKHQEFADDSQRVHDMICHPRYEEWKRFCGRDYTKAGQPELFLEFLHPTEIQSGGN